MPWLIMDMSLLARAGDKLRCIKGPQAECITADYQLDPRRGLHRACTDHGESHI